MNKKGFTLTELLGIMVILAILALIAVPLISRHIRTSREESAKRSADGIYRAAINFYTNEVAEHGFFEEDLHRGPISEIANKLELEKGVTISTNSGNIVIDRFGEVQVFYIVHRMCVKMSSDMDTPEIFEDIKDCDIE